MNDGVYLLDKDAFLDFVEAMTEFYGKEVVSDDKGDSRIEEV